MHSIKKFCPERRQSYALSFFWRVLCSFSISLMINTVFMPTGNTVNKRAGWIPCSAAPHMCTTPLTRLSLTRDLAQTALIWGTGAQPMSSTYFLIREALDINPVKTVYLGISFSSLLKEENDSGKLGAYDRLITLRGRLRCIVDETSNNRRVNELFYSTRVNKYLDLNTVKTNLKEKLDPAYETTPPESDGNRYMYKGYLASDRIFSGKRTTEENKEYNVWDPENISQENLDYLVKIINLCVRKKGWI